MLIVALALINQYYFGASRSLYFGGLLLILFVLVEGVALVRITPLIDEIRKFMAAQR